MWRSTTGTTAVAASSITIGPGVPGRPTGGLHAVAAVGVTVADATAAGAAAPPLREPSLASLAACCSVSCVAAAGATCVGATGAGRAGGTGSATAGMVAAGGGGTAIGVDAMRTGGGGGGAATTVGVDTPGLRLLSLASRARCSSVSSVVIAMPSALLELRVLASGRDGWARGRLCRGRSRRCRRIDLTWLGRVSLVRCFCLWRGGCGGSVRWRGRRGCDEWRNNRGLRRSLWGCGGRGCGSWH